MSVVCLYPIVVDFVNNHLKWNNIKCGNLNRSNEKDICFYVYEQCLSEIYDYLTFLHFRVQSQGERAALTPFPSLQQNRQIYQ